MKKTILLLVGFAAIFASCQSQKKSSGNALTQKQTKDGWQLLFDGKTTNGWHSYGKSGAGDIWKVQDGAIMRDTAKTADGKRKAGGDLVTDAEFTNYHLKLDWKIAPKGNSGIIYNLKEDAAKYPNTYNTGMEMQVLDNDGHPDGKIHKHRAGDLYDLIASSKETVKPVGQWNTAEIVVNNGKLEQYLNGTLVVSTTMWDDNWKQMIANSKFKTMNDFGTFKTGKIALQDHGNLVYYRNIMIKRL